MRAPLIASLLVASIALVTTPAQASSYAAIPVGFTFVDATTGGVALGLSATDDAVVNVALPFAFNFFGTDYTSAFVSSNGLITFAASGNTAFTNSDLSASPTAPTIAAYWDDLYVTGTVNTDVYARTMGPAGSRTFTIEWAHMSYFDDSPRSGDFSFEATLFEGSPIIRLSYLNLATGHNGAGHDNAASATVGVTNGAGDFLTLAFNTGTNQFVGAERSTLIGPTAAVPEPASMLLVGTGVAGLIARRRRR